MLVVASASFAQVSTRPGIGAIPFTSATGNGTTFRTFAPFADSVAVAGTFNFWSTTSRPLFSEGNGYWSFDVPLAQAGAQYKFHVRRGTQALWRNDPRARDLVSSVGNSVVYDPNTFVWQTQNFSIPSWDKLVMYEMHVGTFGTSTSGATPSTLDQCVAKLDHLVELGVNVIALMPTCEFPTDRSWGYNASYLFSVESAYGNPNDLKEFVDAAHSRGIAVTTDVVFNHIGPSDMDMWQFDGWSQNNLGGIFFYNDYRAYTPWGDTRPDFGRGEVRTFLRDNALMWLNEFRMDGLRIDGTKYIRRVGQDGPDIPDGWSLLQWINNDIDAISPQKLIVAEDMDVNHFMTKTTGAGGAGFDSQWDSSFYPPIRTAAITPNDADRNMFSVRDAIAFSYNGSMQQRVIYSESHDEVANGKQRVPEEISPGNAGSWYARKRSTLAAAIVMSSPGIPLLFQGQEFLEDEWFRDDVPLDWSRKITYAGIFKLYQDLIALRTNATGVSRGLSGFSTNVFHVNNTDKVIAFHRWQNGGELDDTIIIANFSATPKLNYRIGVPRAGLWKCRFNSDWTGYSSDYANTLCVATSTDSAPWDGLAQSALVSVGAYSVIMFSQGDPPPTYSPQDLNHDGVVNAADLTVLLSAWGTAGSAADIDGDGIVAGSDLASMLSAWTG
ncbi:MAG: 1,4-alpha-glucan branching protein [Phycisphaerales bacterium]|nr:1,4-alpha-glucan branching protein [Phycisphaerales bacterium]